MEKIPACVGSQVVSKNRVVSTLATNKLVIIMLSHPAKLFSVSKYIPEEFCQAVAKNKLSPLQIIGSLIVVVMAISVMSTSSPLVQPY